MKRETDSCHMAVPRWLVKKAKGLGINCSFEARKALKSAVAAREKENVRAPVAKPCPDTDQSHDLCEVKGQ